MIVIDSVSFYTEHLETAMLFIRKSALSKPSRDFGGTENPARLSSARAPV